MGSAISQWVGAREDPHKLFSYNTKQQVFVRDRWLGFANVCLQILIMTYIVLGIFIYSRGYLEFEQARGAIVTIVRGEAVAVSSGKPGTRYFSAEEITFPGLENGNVFVTTRQKIFRQQRGVCEDYTMPCSTDADCTVSVQGKCTEGGYCKEPSWCNIEDIPEIYELEVGDLQIWTKSSIQFLKLARDKVFSTENDHPYPEMGVNLFSVRSLLERCKPVPVRYEEISELGAAIEVQFNWHCNVARSTQDCKPEIEVRRLDVLFDPENIGYSFSYSEHISDDERLLFDVHGIRLFLRTSGQGRKMSLTDLVMKASTTATLLGIAPIICDLLMLKAFKHRQRFNARKYEISPDFSTYMRKLKKKQNQEQLLPRNTEVDMKVQAEEERWQNRLDEDD